MDRENQRVSQHGSERAGPIVSPFRDPRERLTKRASGRVGRICSGRGCSQVVEIGERFCERCKVQGWQEDARRRGNERQRGYGRLHKDRRAAMLPEHPLCVMCLAEGRRREATVRDHIVALADGGEESEENTQGLCRWCHARKSAGERRARKARAGSGRAGG